MDVQTLIDKAGSIPNLCNLLGVARTTVLDWRRTGFIPGNRVAQVSVALDIPVDEVVVLVEAPKTRKPA